MIRTSGTLDHTLRPHRVEIDELLLRLQQRDLDRRLAAPGGTAIPQREGSRLLVKVATQGSMLVTFTQKVAELDLLLELGDRVELITPGYATFV